MGTVYSVTKKFGILTAGGDCPGLNAAIRGVCRTAHDRYGMKIIGISNGFRGLIDEDVGELKPEDFSGILTLGGTILGSSREKPFPAAGSKDEDFSEVAAIKETYSRLELDCLVVPTVKILKTSKSKTFRLTPPGRTQI